MPPLTDGPANPNFTPIPFAGTAAPTRITGLPRAMAGLRKHAPSGRCVAQGIPFRIDKVVAIGKKPITVKIPPTASRWLIINHTSDRPTETPHSNGFYPSTSGNRLGEHVADYVFIYDDGSEVSCPIRRYHEIASITDSAAVGFGALIHQKAVPMRPYFEQPDLEHWKGYWGPTQGRVAGQAFHPWKNWLWAWQSPHPDKAVVAVRFEPRAGHVIINAITATDVEAPPTRWLSRRKTILKMPKDVEFDHDLDNLGLLEQIQLDLGIVINSSARAVYDNATWTKRYNNKLPTITHNEIHIEYTAHPDACFHLWDGSVVPVTKLLQGKRAGRLLPVAPADRRVTVKVIDKQSRLPVPVKLHIHGESDEYLPTVNHHRRPAPRWFEDLGGEITLKEIHHAAYIPGEADFNLPLGRVYIEVSKGFEVKPVHKVVRVSARTKTITIEIEKVLPWRENGWVTADTHVHFLPPSTALLEAAGEGVNVINLLASQWGELMTNTADYDGKTTHGSKQAGGDGEYLVRVGSENRQNVLGHISLCGYSGKLIGPMTTGGPGESAIGDPVEALLTEWGHQCKAQGGLVIMPHLPYPRCENAAAIIDGAVDGVEMCSWDRMFNGIDPYSLSDWYRYLNCGYHVPVVGGTDKMAATTPVGLCRTYARIPTSKPFTFDNWMAAVRDGNTFCTYGPLMEYAVDGKPAGKRIKMKRSGGTVDVTWSLASVIVPMTRIDLVVNGEIRESKAVEKWQHSGSWSVKIDRSSWLAILVRGQYPEKPEMVAAHSSTVFVELAESPFFAAADAVTILEQIEGALAFIDTVGTRAEVRRYKEMRATLTTIHRRMHNRMHDMGVYHDHTAVDHHHGH